MRPDEPEDRTAALQAEIASLRRQLTPGRHAHITVSDTGCGMS